MRDLVLFLVPTFVPFTPNATGYEEFPRVTSAGSSAAAFEDAGLLPGLECPGAAYAARETLGSST